MNLLVDANVILAVLLNEPEKSLLIKATEGFELLSPEILPYEIGNALSAMVKRERIGLIQAYTCYSAFKEIPVRLVPSEIELALQIVDAYKIYAYDAYYLELARRMRSQLLTMDKKMKNAAKDLGIKVLEV